MTARIKDGGIIWISKRVWFTHVLTRLQGTWGMMQRAIDAQTVYLQRTLAMGAHVLQSLVHNPSHVPKTVTKTLKDMEAATQTAQ